MVIAIVCALTVLAGTYVLLRLLPAELRRNAAVERQATVEAAAEMVVRLAGDRLDQQARAGSSELDVRTQDISRQLGKMTDLVAALQRDRATQHGELVSSIEAQRRASTELAGITGQLREALASPKARGAWGERMAEDVLRRAGLVEGLNYRKQTSVTGGSTIPDFTFLLPRDHVVHMDVKFPIDNYLRHLDADTEIERERTAKQFLRDVKLRVKELTSRGYVNAEHTVDFLLLFIPNESVYAFIHEQDPELLDHAMAKKVVLCSPFSLFSLLAVIRRAMDNFLVEQTSTEILRCLGGFREQWDKVTDAMEKVGRGIDTTQRAFDDLNGTRRRAFEKKLGEIEDLQQRRGLEETASSSATPELDVRTEVARPSFDDLRRRRAG
jgi:DNA recombination protein RmuC